MFNGFNDQCLIAASDDEQQLGHDDNNKLSREIQRIVPPLSSRLKDGMTFAEFSRETTKQYYGGSGDFEHILENAMLENVKAFLFIKLEGTYYNSDKPANYR
ncbi:hypothetical protein RIF29_11958 [Crotalaria pallida]|uniref:Uncharacterized protein n=1 Tax=Crotalaria pallida TaxID=3830 RepID=A0AAN9IMP0_CROPI